VASANILPGPRAAFPGVENGARHIFQAVETPNGIGWVDAQAWAVAHQGHLATIRSKAENDFVYKLIEDPKFWIINAPYNEHNLGPWLGGHRLPGAASPDQNWVWVGDGSKMTYTNWAPNEPDDNGYGEDRLHFMSYNPNDRQPTWNDVGVEYRLRGFVVEYDLKTLPAAVFAQDPPQLQLPLLIAAGFSALIFFTGFFVFFFRKPRKEEDGPREPPAPTPPART